MSTGNKRVTQLVELTATEVAADDLFYVVDISALESKKITADQLASYLSISGSLYVLHALNADTASYILGSNVVTPVLSSSYAVFADSTTSASWADRAMSSSHAITSSFALSLLGGIGAAVSASWASSSYTASHALYSEVAATTPLATFLYYDGFTPNGTASWAVSASHTQHVTTADTASYWNNTTSTVASASYADKATEAALATQSLNSITASYLEYSSNNGTASYAIAAGSIAGVMNNFGLFQYTFQSATGSGIHVIRVLPTSDTLVPTIIEAFGNINVEFTASNLTHKSLSMYLMDLKSGNGDQMDLSSVDVNITPSMGMWGDYFSGSIMMPFNMITQVPLNGYYMVRVDTSEPRVTIDSDRPVRFQISSMSDFVDADVGIPIQFNVQPSSSVTLSFYATGSGLGVGPFTDQLDGFNASGSATPKRLNISSQSVTSVAFSWLLTSLEEFSCSMNPDLTDLTFQFAPTLVTMSCRNNGIQTVCSFANTTASIIDFNTNQLVVVPELSPSVSFLDVGNNPVTALPSSFPQSLKTLGAGNTLINGTIPYLPDGLEVADFSNTAVDTLPDPLPLSLSYLDISTTLVATMSNAPLSLSYLNLSNSLWNSTGLVNITYDLIANTQQSGTLDIRGLGTPSDPQLITNLFVLTSSYWLILKDP